MPRISTVQMVAPAAAVLAVAAGTAVAADPVTGVAAAAGLPAAAAIVASARVRLFVVTLGALLVFQSTANGAKYAYIAAAGACFALSAVRLARTSDDLQAAFRPLLPAGALVVGMLAISGLVANSEGTSVGSWSSDALPYALLVVLPVVGIDAATDMSPRLANWLIGSLGLLAAIGFALDWLDRRGVSSLGVGRVVLATITMPALAFTYAIVQAARGIRPVRWAVMALLIAALVLVTGTRTNLVLVLAFVGVLGARIKARFPPGRLVLIAGGIGAGAAVMLPVLGGIVLSDSTFLSRRLASAFAATQNGLTDQSFVIRAHSYAVARERFMDHPWFGGGPGYLYQAPDSMTFSLDTPWAVPAKFGVIGTAVLLLFLAAVVLSVRRTRQAVGYRHTMTTARGWAVIMAALTPFGPWIEDKGTALTLTLVVALVMSDAHHARRAETAGESAAEPVPVVGVRRPS